MPAQDRGITLVPIASSLHDPASTARVLGFYRKWLKGSYNTEFSYATSPEDIGRAELRDSTGLLTLVLTGGTEQILGAIARLGRPLLVLAHESMNSLPAALEAMSTFSGPGARLTLGTGR